MFLPTVLEMTRFSLVPTCLTVDVKLAILNSSITTVRDPNTRLYANTWGVLSPWEIKAIRLRFKMTRAEFARLSGLGEATLARWEKGLVTQNRANDRYLRLLAEPGGIDRLLMATYAANSDIKGTTPLEQRFPAIRITNELRKEQQNFQLRKVA